MTASLENRLVASTSLSAESWSTPAIYLADEKTAGVVVCCDRSGSVRVLSGTDLELIWTFDAGAPITASPLVVSRANGGAIVVIGDEKGVLHALNIKDGSHCWRVETGDCIRSTAAYDTSEDALYIGVYGPRVIKLDAASGDTLWKTYLPKHEFFAGTKRGVVSSPLLADVDLDGELEVVIGMRSRRMFCLSAVNGRIKWFREVAYDPDSSPSFAVIDGDPMVFFGGGEHTSGPGDRAVFALNGNDGSIAWRAQVHGGLDSSPVIADINGDGELEVVITSLADASCYSFNAATGRPGWRFRFGPTADCVHDEQNICRRVGDADYFTGHAVCRSYTTPLVGDIDADGSMEVIVGSNNGVVVCLSGKDGTLRWSDETGSMVRGSPVIADIDADGHDELLITSGDRLRVYRVASSGLSWPMFQGGYTHTGWIGAPEEMPLRNGLGGQRFLRLKLFWYWWIKDGFRYLVFQLDRKLLRPFGLRILDYYY